MTRAKPRKPDIDARHDDEERDAAPEGLDDEESGVRAPKRRGEQAAGRTAKGAAKAADAPAKKGRKAAKAAKAAKKVARKSAKLAEKAARRLEVRDSPVHGKGVFAREAIPAGKRLIEYVGEVIDWPEALRRHPHDPSQPHHTFYFSRDDGFVIDANVGGNDARWINHSCDPNCTTEEKDDGRVLVLSLRDLEAGEELSYDYCLQLDGRHTRKIKQQYACRCGAANCRGTMLAPKD